MKGAQPWLKAALLKCLKDRNDIYEWVLGSQFGSLIDLEQEVGQWLLMLRSERETERERASLCACVCACVDLAYLRATVLPARVMSLK